VTDQTEDSLPADPTTPERRQVAVALKHDRADAGAPRVVATGRGALAESILELAFATGVKVREDADLAEILAALDMDSEIPVAAVISQVLPNGNLVLHGRQEVRVNFEVRELQIAGIIRPEDITSENTISYEKVAEARISYGGRGQITDVEQPRYGQQVLDIIFPF
jgi:flagellar L-ring protein precursor FlgH